MNGRADDLHRSPLHQRHLSLGARMGAFGGWEMPISYPTGTIDEHRACRSAAAVFDVSHLGTVRVEGPGAFGALQWAFTNDLGRVGVGRAQYTHLLDPEDASVADDLIVWWVSEHRFDVMPNASNTDRVRSALAEARPEAARPEDVTIHDVTSTRAVLALQGPAAATMLASVGDGPAVGRFRVAELRIAGQRCVVAGTGYTGEAGVELAVPAAGALVVWDALLAAGAVPAGLGARDTLRLEAGLPLHGHELGPGITSDEAGLSWVVRPDKGPFLGREAVLAARQAGARRHLVGIATQGRQPPRDGSDVLSGGTGDTDGREVVGRVTSGNFSPTLGHGIALAYVRRPMPVGTAVVVEVRGRALDGVVTRLPFVRG